MGKSNANNYESFINFQDSEQLITLVKLLDKFEEFMGKYGEKVFAEYDRYVLHNENNLAEYPALQTFFELRQGMAEFTMWAPGQVIALNDLSKVTRYNNLLESAFKHFDEMAFYLKIMDGEHNELGEEILSYYIENAKNLKPIFIHSKYAQGGFVNFFNEAMRAWVFGLNIAALLLTHSIVEETLRLSLYEKFGEEYIDLYVQDGYDFRPSRRWRMWDLIQTAKQKQLLDVYEAEFLEEMSRTRNNATHQLKVTELRKDKVLVYIQSSVQLVEKLFS